tara:strand:- start:155 stop:601 length:447 start_codon:yes stop_codon:yes gene_type:complete
MIKDFIIKELKSISVLAPSSYSFFKVSSDDNLDINSQIARFFEDEGLEFFMFYDLERGFYCDIHYTLPSGNLVNHSCEGYDDFKKCLGIGLSECFKVLDKKYAPSEDMSTFLDAVTIGAIKRDKQKKFFKSELGKRMVAKKKKKKDEE